MMGAMMRLCITCQGLRKIQAVVVVVVVVAVVAFFCVVVVVISKFPVVIDLKQTAFWNDFCTGTVGVPKTHARIKAKMTTGRRDELFEVFGATQSHPPILHVAPTPVGATGRQGDHNPLGEL